TAGAIAGSLAGGFGLLPMLTAIGTWKAVVLVLVAWGLLSSCFALYSSRACIRPALCTTVSILALLCLQARGPTAVWRHSGIGAGRAALPKEPIALRNWQRSIERRTVWEAEGIEAGVAIQANDGYAFVINGKVDGNAINDAGTQIMLGMLGAF